MFELLASRYGRSLPTEKIHGLDAEQQILRLIPLFITWKRATTYPRDLPVEIPQ
ncbi:hypothetical protein KIN20_036592 [Parelaphostrongylus tenuis]|uniref:Uncharacterized protein n=1 Tax=Parelaphostrongylus tenuis TaxID=148309 RepID=A0AAD5RGE3_PARTN|nr:hypothetical protein KIN20_036592 [Parelaphostrongylus tenuis]